MCAFQLSVSTTIGETFTNITHPDRSSGYSLVELRVKVTVEPGVFVGFFQWVTYGVQPLHLRGRAVCRFPGHERIKEAATYSLLGMVVACPCGVRMKYRVRGGRDDVTG